MAIDLTPAVKAEMMVSRLELPDGIFPILEFNDDAAGWTQIVTLDPSKGYDWDATMRTSVGSVPKQYINLRIIDTPDFESVVFQTTAVTYDGLRYKVSRVTRPFGVPRIWLFRLDYSDDA